MSERFTSDADVKLTQQINDATAAAERTQANLNERYVSIGRLLIGVKKLYPKRADFEEFLKQTNLGVLRSRAYDLMTMVDPKEAQRLLQQNRDRVARHREKKHPSPNPPNPPTAGNDVDAMTSAAQRKAENAKSRSEPMPDSAVGQERKRQLATRKSAQCLLEFEQACRIWLPQLSEADLGKALAHVAQWRLTKKEAA